MSDVRDTTIGGGVMDWDEFEQRGAERRRNRSIYPKRSDRLSVAVGAGIGFLVILWIVWGVTS